MSFKVGTHQLNHAKNIFIKKIVSSSALGYLAGRIFSAINPLSGFIFNLTAEIVFDFTRNLFKKTNFLKNSMLTKGLIKSFISFSAAFYVANYIGDLSLACAFKVAAFTVITQIAFANIFLVGVALGGFAIFTSQVIYSTASKLKSLKA